MCYIKWDSVVAEKPCYEALNEIERYSYHMPYEWVDGKKFFPYGYHWTLERLAKYRKDSISKGEKPLIGDYKESCNRCQIKIKCDAGFPEKEGIIAKIKNWLF